MSPALPFQPRSIVIAALAVLVSAAPCGSLLAVDVTAGEFFEKQVRPILVERCYECHSGNTAKPKGGLRLDSRAAALKGGDTGPAIVPGKAKVSLLVDAINYGEVYQMPPKSKLPAEEITALTKWVEMGAPWPEERSQRTGVRGQGTEGEFDLAKRKAEHWCWQPISRPPVPEIENLKSKIQNPIDAFILAKLQSKGLSPAPLADQRTLIRRAYFDLIGLPPSAEELERFLAVSPSLLRSVTPSVGDDRGTERQRDGEKVNFESLVDHLLASPHFGERWGRHWLDLVRYAESRGHEFDYNIPNAFEYRDYAIRALNADVPYDQFVTEHIAGDLLVKPRLHPRERFNESIIGTGFWFLGECFHSPVDIRKDECDRIDNMLDVFSKSFLGVTVACARCHDHKFDAISQRDYYALAGYLQSSSYRLARFETWNQDREVAAELAALDAKYRPRIAAEMAKALAPRVDEFTQQLLEQSEATRDELAVAEVDLRGANVIVDYSNCPPDAWMADGPILAMGLTRAGQIVLTGNSAAPLNVEPHGCARREGEWGDLGMATISENDPARLGGWVRAGRTLKTPTFTLNSGKVHYLIEGVGHVYAAVDSHVMINGPLHAELLKETGGNSDLPTRWITHDLSRYVGHRVHLEFSPKEFESFRVLKVVESAERPAAPAGRANAFVSELAQDGLTMAECHELVTSTLAALAADRITADPLPRDRAAVANWLISKLELGEQTPKPLGDVLEGYTAAQGALFENYKTGSRLCLAMWEGTAIDESLLIRGNHKTVGPVVPRRLLEAIQGSGVEGQESEANNRLALARQLVDARNPLISRVIVNRVWAHLMGRGIVPSVDNFGVLGQKPTHPELLDYLADEFVRDGWSIKRLIRRIMLSNTYKQASGIRGQESAERVDPQNLLFRRQNLKRLEGEAIRDSILAISGRLDRTLYGPSVPVYLTPFMQGRGRPKDSGPLDGASRRSIYTAVRRNFLPPMMLAFDTPIPFTTIGQRNTSNVPAQALILMNDPFVAEQSRHWARQLLADKAASPTDSIRKMYLAGFSREPTAAETDAALGFVTQQANEYGLSSQQAAGDDRVWGDLAHVVFNVKEFLLVD